jgi:hypothetical protein
MARLRGGQLELKIEARRAACDCGIPRRNLRVSSTKRFRQRPFQRYSVLLSVACREFKSTATAQGRSKGFTLAVFWKINVP